MEMYPVQPVPKYSDPKAYRPISLLSCIGKTMERIILTQQNPRTPQKIFTFRKNAGTSDNMASFRSILDHGTATLVLLDLEKAFELADLVIITSILADKGIKGKLLAWTSDFLTKITIPDP
ncbi:uncharacterized protein LOC119595019 [Penaeus monodon]|uniref:uncharacterized protein LOC119595019 n=1 Tax=Penaeus monodon TaxID=6687 RepID=UPI0018A6DCE3|nr:uncharacterized protein LOC119595019 [Penaeus monodon]